jgi:hypothetical protein
MAAVRSWHPIRLALMCAMLALAGGAPGARGGYAEVASASVAARVRVQARRAPGLAALPAARVPAVGGRVSRSAPRLVVAALYLTHCSLLL